MSVFTSWLNSKKLRFRNRSLSRNYNDISTFRCSEIKPPRVQSRALTLFHRPKTVWVAMQIVFFAALTVWTVKNYVHVIKSF